MTANEVVINHVSKTREGRAVLDDVSIVAAPGMVVSVVGPSGAGKSTLLRAINGLDSIDGGSISVGGRTVGVSFDGRSAWSPREEAAFRAGVGFVFQDLNLFPHKTVLDNVVVAQRVVLGRKPDVARANARALLDRVGLSDFESRYPATLSGGQQQRVAIARSLAMDPGVILFDEVTSSLDPELAAEVLLVIRELARDGLTMFIVTHELAFARDVSDHLVLLEAGRVVEQGPPHVLFSTPAEPRTAEFLKTPTSPTKENQ